jgi:hypothetical protein
MRNWCSYTRDVMAAVGLAECWRQQRAVKADEMGLTARVVTKISSISGEMETTVYPPHRTDWKVVARKATRTYEQRKWLEAMTNRPKLDLYRQWKTSLEREAYLSSPDVIGRETLFRLRSGTNDLRIDTGRSEMVRDRTSGRRRRLERNERICRQCGVEVEDVTHVLLYCPMYVAIRRDLMRELMNEQSGDLGLHTFLRGLCDVSTIMSDREEAEKTMILMMGKDRIMQTMGLAKRIMRHRGSIVREREDGSARDEEELAKSEHITVPPNGRLGTNPVRSRRKQKRKLVLTEE